jgi:hypothetical protein
LCHPASLAIFLDGSMPFNPVPFHLSTKLL